MGLADHYRGGATERLVVTIVTSDPTNRRIEGVGRDAAVLQIEVNYAYDLRWPEVGDQWTILRENGRWQLAERLLTSSDWSNIATLKPGEKLSSLSHAINADDYQSSGSTDETALLRAVDRANQTGRPLYIPKRASEWVIGSRLPILNSIEVFGSGTVIRQKSWRTPIFDLETTDDVYVHDFYLRSTEGRVSGAGSVRGDDEDRYGAGVWGAGDRVRVERIRAYGLDSAVHATNWVSGSTHSGRPTGWVIKDIFVDTVDFGVLCVSHDRPHVENIYGSVARSTGSGDPCHLVYLIGVAAGDTLRGATGGNWRAADSGLANNDPAYQLRNLDGATLNNIFAINCGGLMTFDGLVDCRINQLMSLNDQRSDEAGSLASINPTSVRTRFTNVSIVKGVGGRAVYWDGTDCTIEDLLVVANRTSINFNEDVKLAGTRNKIVRLRHSNAGSNSTGAEAVNVLGTAIDCEIIDPEIRNAVGVPGCNNSIVIRSGATRTVVKLDLNSIESASGAKVSNSGTGTRIVADINLFSEIGAAGAAETTASTTYVGLATSGPSVTAPVSGVYEIEVGGAIGTAAVAGNTAFMSYAYAAVAPSDAWAAYITTPSAAGNSGTVVRKSRATLAAGDTVVAQYRSSAAAAGTVSFTRRWISARLVG